MTVSGLPIVTGLPHFPVRYRCCKPRHDAEPAGLHSDRYVQCCGKVFAHFLISRFLHICHTYVSYHKTHFRQR